MKNTKQQPDPANPIQKAPEDKQKNAPQKKPIQDYPGEQHSG